MSKEITNKEYERYLEYKRERLNGRLITKEFLRKVCEAHEFNAEAIGEYILKEVYPKL